MSGSYQTNISLMWGNGYGYQMMDYGSGYGVGSAVVHALFAIFWLVVLVAVIAMAVRALRGKPVWRHHGCCGRDAAMNLLRERYVKGEIDHKEFEEKKKVLAE